MKQFKLLILLTSSLFFCSCQKDFWKEYKVEDNEREQLKEKEYIIRGESKYFHSNSTENTAEFKILKNDFPDIYPGWRKGEFILIQINNWTIYYPKTGRKEIYTFDSLGFLLKYEDYKSGKLTYNAKYEHIKDPESNSEYRIESITAFNNSGKTYFSGKRVNRKIPGSLPYYTKNKRVGDWVYYNELGEIVKIKSYPPSRK